MHHTLLGMTYLPMEKAETNYTKDTGLKQKRKQAESRYKTELLYLQELTGFTHPYYKTEEVYCFVVMTM